MSIVNLEGKDMPFEAFKNMIAKFLQGKPPENDREKILYDVIVHSKIIAEKPKTYLEALTTAWLLYSAALDWLLTILEEDARQEAIQLQTTLSSLTVNLLHNAWENTEPKDEGEAESTEGKGEDSTVSGPELGPTKLN